MKYEALAPIYDRLMSHVEYDQWADLIGKVIGKYLPVQDPAILEVGAGTGILGEMLTSLGFCYTGSDLSLPMCKEARRRNLPVFCADARSIPIKKQFHLAIFLYDGINYLQTIQDYKILFSEVHKCLTPNGLFLFDITTETNSLRHFIDYLDFEEFGGDSLVRHSYYIKNKALQYNDFTIFRRSQSKPPLYEKYQRTSHTKDFTHKTH